MARQKKKFIVVELIIGGEIKVFLVLSSWVTKEEKAEVCRWPQDGSVDEQVLLSLIKDMTPADSKWPTVLVKAIIFKTGKSMWKFYT